MNNYALLIPVLLSSIMGFTNYLKGMHEDATLMKSSLIGGVRTFFLLSLSGLISGWLFTHGNLIYAITLTISVVLLVLSYFIVTASQNKNASFSDELSAIMAHILSFLWIGGSVPQQVLVAVFVATIFILEQREFLVSLKDKLNVKEFSQIVVFLVIALIVLPFLPNFNFSLKDLGIDPSIFGITNGAVAKLSVLGLFNPYKLWFFVVFVSGLDIFGYLLKKAFSKSASVLLTSMIGGFITSTSTTIGLAQHSKAEPQNNQLVAGALLANVVSFIQIAILIAPISAELLRIVAPFLLSLIAVGTIVALVLLEAKATRQHKHTTEKTDMTSETDGQHEAPIFRLGPAIKFAVLLTVVGIVAKVSLVLIGSTGFILTSIIASLTGIDAITITLADLFYRSTIGVSMSVWVFILVNVVNLGSKIVYSFFSGSKEFATKFALGTGLMLAIATAVQLLVV